MAGFVGVGESIADIGSDHAYLPLYLVSEGISPFAVLTDKAAGPLDKTRTNINMAAVPSLFDLRLGDGLSALLEAEVDTVIIAGLGGETIISILEADPDKAVSFRKYILQPRTKTELLDKWLDDAGWEVIAKTTADERGRRCAIIVCAPNTCVPKEGVT